MIIVVDVMRDATAALEAAVTLSYVPTDHSRSTVSWTRAHIRRALRELIASPITAADATRFSTTEKETWFVAAIVEEASMGPYVISSIPVPRPYHARKTTKATLSSEMIAATSCAKATIQALRSAPTAQTQLTVSRTRAHIRPVSSEPGALRTIAVDAVQGVSAMATAVAARTIYSSVATQQPIVSRARHIALRRATVGRTRNATWMTTAATRRTSTLSSSVWGLFRARTISATSIAIR